MRKAVYVGGLLALALTLCGCGSSPDSHYKDMIRCLNEIADALGRNEPPEKITEIQTRMKEIEKKLNALNLPEAEKEKLKEKHKDALDKAQMRVIKASMKNSP